MNKDCSVHVGHDANGNLIVSGNGNQVYVFPGITRLTEEILARLRSGQLNPGEIPGAVPSSRHRADAPTSVKAFARRIADLAAALDDIHADQQKRMAITREVSLPRMIAGLRSAQARAEARRFREQVQLDTLRMTAIDGALREASALADVIRSERVVTGEEGPTLTERARELRDLVETVCRQVRR